MRSASVRFSIVLSAALPALLLLGSNVLAQTVSLGVESQFSPNPVPVCVQSSAVLSVAWTAPPPAPYPCSGWTSPSWAWSINGASGVSISSFDNTNAYVSASICTPGAYSITVTATATWQDACGNTTSASGSVTLASLTVVAVTSITPLSEVQQKNIGDTLTKADFSITTNPPGYVDLVTVAPVTIQLGDNTVTATCGCSSATTEIIGCQCSCSLSDLFVGPNNSDDSMSFTALVQGCGGGYTITGSNSTVVIDGGDTSGSLNANETHYGIFYISSKPPDDLTTSRLPIFLNGSVVYGLGGIPGSIETRQVNGQTSGIAKNVVRGVAAIGILVGVYTVVDYTTLHWNTPIYSPVGRVKISTSTDNNQWNPTTVNCNSRAYAFGITRWSAFGFKYTEDPNVQMDVGVPDPLSVTDPNNKPVSVWTYSQANLAGRSGEKDWEEQNTSLAIDFVDGKTQIRTGTEEAGLWVGTGQQVDPAWTQSDTKVNVLFYYPL